MPAKTNSMKNLFANALAVVFGIITWLYNGADLSQLLQINSWDVVIAIGKLLQVGIAGMIGAVGGVVGKKYLMPWIDRKYKKHFTTKNKKS